MIHPSFFTNQKKNRSRRVALTTIHADDLLIDGLIDKRSFKKFLRDLPRHVEEKQFAHLVEELGDGRHFLAC